jgi:hypothetical protein
MAKVRCLRDVKASGFAYGITSVYCENHTEHRCKLWGKMPSYLHRTVRTSLLDRANATVYTNQNTQARQHIGSESAHLPYLTHYIIILELGYNVIKGTEYLVSL